MAIATTLKFSELKVMLDVENGDGTTFVAPCGMTGRSIVFEDDTSEVPVLDCDDEDLVAAVVRDKTSSSVTISGDGVVARQSIERWRKAKEDRDPVITRIQITGPGSDNGGRWQGNFLVTRLELGATRGERVTIGVTLVSSGTITWTDAA